MTASLFVTALRAGSPGPGNRGAARVEDGTHAVARPAVDGLELSVCGVLVQASAAQDWGSTPAAGRCEECARIAG